jgi:tRNA(Ile2) C34 agmatinyltransferase TiaS
MRHRTLVTPTCPECGRDLDPKGACHHCDTVIAPRPRRRRVRIASKRGGK